MDDDLACLPLARTNRRAVSVIFCVIAGLFGLSLALFLASLSKFNFSDYFRFPIGWMLTAWSASFFWLAIWAYRRRLSLLIDSNGIHVIDRATKRDYTWTAIDHIRNVVYNRRSRATAPQIVRKGQLAFDDKSDLISPEFGLDEDQLKKIIAAGKARWGNS